MSKAYLAAAAAAAAASMLAVIKLNLDDGETKPTKTKTVLKPVPVAKKQSKPAPSPPKPKKTVKTLIPVNKTIIAKPKENNKTTKRTKLVKYIAIGASVTFMTALTYAAYVVFESAVTHKFKRKQSIRTPPYTQHHNRHSHENLTLEQQTGTDDIDAIDTTRQRI